MKGVHPMETLRFSDFLDSYIQTMPDSMQDGMLYRLTYAENLTRLTFYVTFPQLVPANDLFSLEKTLQQALEIETVRIAPNYAATLCQTAYFPELLQLLKREQPVVNGFFDHAQIQQDGQNWTITLKNGGYEIVQRYHVAEQLQNLLQRLFSVSIKVEILGEAAVSTESYQQMQETAEKTVSKHTEQLQATAPAKSSDKAEPAKSKPVALSVELENIVPDSATLIKGRTIRDNPISITEALGREGQRSVILADVFAMEVREVRGERTVATYQVTDYENSVLVKLFDTTENLKKIPLGEIKKGSTLLLLGRIDYDNFAREMVLKPDSIMMVQRKKKEDHAEKKRVELHCHTAMSQMDAITEAGKLVNRAHEWGHPAIAITDHGIAQAFPDAMNAWNAIKDPNFKIIYGCEAYVVNDLQKKTIIDESDPRSLQDEIIIFDVETTGLSYTKDRLTEIGAVKLRNLQIVDTFSIMVNPGKPIPPKIVELTGITDQMVANAPGEREAIQQFMEFCGSEKPVLAAHNARFDTSFIRNACERQHISFSFVTLDTLILSQVMLPNIAKHKLDSVAKALKLGKFDHHRACNDAQMLAKIYVKLVSQLIQEKGLQTLAELNTKTEEIDVKKLKSYHQIILVRNQAGLKNLYKLISYGHLKYFYRKPLLPKSVLQEHREGLIFGSACEAGELFRALVENRPHEEIVELAKFYDYLEIQPLGNNAFMIADEKNDRVKSNEDLIELNKKIVKLGDQFKKPVVATCDVHFMDPQDEIYRRIIMAGNGFSDADNQAPLYLRTTEEMLEEFSYLGSEKAEEVVITNTNKIADMIEKISPIHPDKFPPVIENSDQDLKDICFNRAHEMYGENLPKIVEDRLNKELHSIISNGYAVMYIIAQKLVWKSNEDGYLVGSRGSVGSSLAATMSGITEVNPLPPHYLCPECKYSDFDSPEVKKFGGMAGCDMPDKVCPKCGAKMSKEGFDIPFETFLGFKGDKEPDIDLNFSGEYQANAHRYTEVIFGKGQTFKAGTIGTLAEKTAFGYVKNYFEERGVHKRYCEINRIVQGCTGVRRTTGQHPGGIIVLPVGEEIEKFTPVQHPANDVNSDIITTHFDYHSIDGNLLKLDILGHDDPTMIRMLEDLTGISARDVPLDQRDVMSLFASTKALKIEPEDIGGCKLGCLGIPEFGTDFAMQMLIDTKPKYFSDLIRIAGLSHGTDVWLGNAQVLIQEGKATISTAICTRDDIMIYLIGKGVESGLAFTIMESVRKGKGLRDEWIETMKEHGVPDWYIWSCKLIKYMFPKAHAAAYVMMAYRIAWYKVFQPLAYYAAYFSIRATAFSYELMCMGKERLEYYMAEIRKKGDSASKKELDTLKDMRIVQEMYARGFEFVPIDLYTAKAQRFQIVDGKLMPSLATIDGLGDKAADAVVDAAKQGKFLSKDDFRDRTKVSKTVIDLMDDLKLFGDIPQSNQMSLFDFTG